VKHKPYFFASRFVRNGDELANTLKLDTHHPDHKQVLVESYSDAEFEKNDVSEKSKKRKIRDNFNDETVERRRAEV